MKIPEDLDLFEEIVQHIVFKVAVFSAININLLNGA